MFKETRFQYDSFVISSASNYYLVPPCNILNSDPSVKFVELYLKRRNTKQESILENGDINRISSNIDNGILQLSMPHFRESYD